MDIYNFDKIMSLALEPEDSEQYGRWILQEDIAQFLNDEAGDEYVIIYASLPHVFLHAVFIPAIKFDEEIVHDLLHWGCNPFSSWGLIGPSEGIGSPLDGSGSKTLESGEQLLFGRSFVGGPDEDTYFEFNQKIAHVLDVHFVPGRKSWCKLDAHGDIDQIIRILEIGPFPKNETGTVVCVKQSSLGEYAGAENLSLLRMFDFTRYRHESFSVWGDNRDHSEIAGYESIHGSLTIVPGAGSFSRGIQILDVRTPNEKIVDAVWGRSSNGEEKQYCSYIAQDWRNHRITEMSCSRITEISCSPARLANYYTESDLPLTMTPAFFRPEVLSKYKADRRKYRLRNRSVGCGSWHLKTFDVNSAGQVHTYLGDLSRLPHEEQLHWKQYNEHPKAPISDRAYTIDFKGEIYEEYDSLMSLKGKLFDLNEENVDWWKLRDENAPGKVHYPYTDSEGEWAEEILNLDQLLIEGFEEAWLRKKAKELGCNPDDRLRSLKLIGTILIKDGFEKDHASEIMSPFRIVHNLRTKLKGHTAGSDAETERKNAISKFGSYKKHFEKLCADCDKSLEIVTNAMEKIKNEL